MTITNSQLSVIQQKASTLIERHGSALMRGEIPDALPLHQLWEWDQRLSGNNAQSLLNRLSLFNELKSQIADVEQQFAHDLKNQSGWIKEFRDILKYYTTDLLHTPPLEFRETRPEAFQSLLIPFVWYALYSLTEKKEFPGLLITRDTLSAHCQSLLKVLSKHSASCFYSAFNDFRKTHANGLAPKTHVVLYQKFENSMYADGIIRFFEEYSALARLLTTVTHQWIRSTHLLISRLQSDLNDLAATFFQSQPLGSVKSMKCGFSAPHSVDGMLFELSFSHGRKVMYKPRSGKEDVALSTMISWFNTSRELEQMQAVQVLDRDKYSWHEYIGVHACQTQREVEQYYTQIGQQAALLHVLGSTDYHFENLRACGVHPYLTDNETLLSPYLKISEEHSFTGDAILDNEIVHSLARSLFLFDTRKLFYPDPESISGVYNSRDRYQIIRYRHVNTDTMYPVKKYQSRRGNNIPKLGRHSVSPRQYSPFIKKGYAVTLQLIHARREEFYILVESATSHFNMEVRMLVRPTSIYAQILFESLRPEFLRDGVARSLLFEKLARFYLTTHAPEESGKLLFEEIAMLENHLVPWFHTKVSDQTWHTTKNGYSVIKRSAQQLFEEKLERLNNPFIDLQVATIDHYLARVSGMSVAPISIPEALHKYQVTGAVELFNASCAIAHHLHFCYRHYYPVNQLYDLVHGGKISMVGHYAFGNGLLGVLVTLAYYDPYLPESCSETIHTLLRPLVLAIQTSGSFETEKFFSSERIHDLGSVIYGLCTLAEKLNDDTLLVLAFQLAEKGFSSSLDKSDNYSIKHGTAGYILGLTKLYSLKPHPTVRRVILDYTHDLLLKSTFYIKNQEVQRQGYFDGTSGVLHACCKVYEATGDRGLSEKIEELYQRCQKHWSDGSIQKTSLADGLAGWMVVNIKAQSILYGTPPDTQVLDVSKQLLLVNARDTDYIASGLAGRCEPALLLGDQLEHELIQLIDTWNRRYAKHRAFVLTPNFLNPFFNEGISGILYQQLRLLFRKKMPSLISFE